MSALGVLPRPNVKAWKPANRPTATSTKRVELSQHTFWHHDQAYRFWALAPRSGGYGKEFEFVWLISEAREVFYACVDFTGRVSWIGGAPYLGVVR